MVAERIQDVRPAQREPARGADCHSDDKSQRTAAARRPQPGRFPEDGRRRDQAGKDLHERTHARGDSAQHRPPGEPPPGGGERQHHRCQLEPAHDQGTQDRAVGRVPAQPPGDPRGPSVSATCRARSTIAATSKIHISTAKAIQ